ncbi:MAG TPA: acyl-CoA dehydrogenase family protein [Acidimicrobiales bacterium]|nr:acyl-CoA dehydrogenase family protein [Acidimicrobiales bacterium]
MDFELSDDQLALRDAARALLDDLASPARVRAHIGAGESHDAGLWAAMVEQGWLGIDQGFGLGFVEAAVLMEEVGRCVAPAPFAPTLLALSALPSGSPWAESLLAGGIGCVGWSRGDARLLVPYAPVADVAVVASPDAVVVHDLRDRRPPRESAMDLTRCVGWLSPDAPGGEQVGGPAEGAALVDRAAVAACAESLGAAGRVLEMTVEHAKTRVQFGKPIGSFQAVKHRCADMLVDLEGMRSTVYHAAWCLSAGDPEASVAASTAKVWCADAARRIMASGLQVHGGIGFTWEHDLHLYLKRAQLDQVTFGDAPVHRERLATLLRERIAAGESVV